MVIVIMYEEYENREREIEIIVDGRYVINTETGEVVGEVFSYQ
jgi:hypothetical protein